MEISIRFIGKIACGLVVKADDHTLTADVLDMSGQAIYNLIEQLREVADQLEEQNNRRTVWLITK